MQGGGTDGMAEQNEISFSHNFWNQIWKNKKSEEF